MRKGREGIETTVASGEKEEEVSDGRICRMERLISVQVDLFTRKHMVSGVDKEPFEREKREEDDEIERSGNTTDSLSLS